MEREGLKIRRGSGKVIPAPGPPQVVGGGGGGGGGRSKRQWLYVRITQDSLGSHLLPQFIYRIMFG